MHRYFEEIEETPLSLELVCGATDVSSKHPGWWRGQPGSADDVHPGQAAVRDALAEYGIRVDAWSHHDDGVDYSDAYVRFYPEQIDVVARILRDVGHPGDVLDIRREISSTEQRRVLAIAEREGWRVER